MLVNNDMVLLIDKVKLHSSFLYGCLLIKRKNFLLWPTLTKVYFYEASYQFFAVPCLQQFAKFSSLFSLDRDKCRQRIV